jgi:hypothetical protein
LRWLEIGVPLVLILLIILNACFSLDPKTSGLRVFILVSSGIGGYVCSRLLLSSEPRRRFFQRFCVGILSFILLISLKNYIFWGDISQSAPWNLNRHVVTDLILLLSFAPLTFLFKGPKREIILGIVLLGFSFLVLYLSSERSAVLIPIGLAVIACLFKGLRRRYAVLIVAVMALLTLSLYSQIPPHQLAKDAVRVYYRIEAYPFSWHIAKKHPFLGKGLLASRESFLEDYEIRYPHITRDQFAWAIGWARSPENMILLLMSELGFVFLFIYGGLLLFLVGRLISMVRKGDVREPVPALAIFLPIAGAIVHYMVFDGLLYPQVCWYFHMLLGLVPRPLAEEHGPTPLPLIC